jgi:DnaJ-class molecular chaperone
MKDGRVACPRCEGEGTIQIGGYDLTCPLCDGMKHTKEAFICRKCGGKGCARCNKTGMKPGKEICKICHGTGKESVCDAVLKICKMTDCKKCKGLGILPVKVM